jgi:hypothetical protein
MDHYAQAKSDAIEAAETVHRFMNQIEDASIRADIAGRVFELDRLIATV